MFTLHVSRLMTWARIVYQDKIQNSCSKLHLSESVSAWTFKIME